MLYLAENGQKHTVAVGQKKIYIENIYIDVNDIIEIRRYLYPSCVHVCESVR